MKKLITIFLILVIGITMGANAFARDVKTTQVSKPAAPIIDPSVYASLDRNGIDIYVKGATSIGDQYNVYYADYNGDDRKKSWKWLKENGKLLSNIRKDSQPPFTGGAFLQCDNPNGSRIVFTVTIVDKNGNESDPAPIQVN